MDTEAHIWPFVTRDGSNSNTNVVGVVIAKVVQSCGISPPPCADVGIQRSSVLRTGWNIASLNARTTGFAFDSCYLTFLSQTDLASRGDSSFGKLSECLTTPVAVEVEPSAGCCTYRQRCSAGSATL